MDARAGKAGAKASRRPPAGAAAAGSSGWWSGLRRSLSGAALHVGAAAEEQQAGQHQQLKAALNADGAAGGAGADTTTSCSSPSSSSSSDAHQHKVPVTIVLERRVGFGERIAVVGDPQALGAWQAPAGLALAWGEGDVWSGEARLPPGTHEFKCVTVKRDGGLEWELGGNRVITVPAAAAGAAAFEARCEWANTAHTPLTASPAGSSVGASRAPSSSSESDEPQQQQQQQQQQQAANAGAGPGTPTPPARALSSHALAALDAAGSGKQAAVLAAAAADSASVSVGSEQEEEEGADADEARDVVLPATGAAAGFVASLPAAAGGSGRMARVASAISSSTLSSLEASDAAVDDSSTGGLTDGERTTSSLSADALEGATAAAAAVEPFSAADAYAGGGRAAAPATPSGSAFEAAAAAALLRGALPAGGAGAAGGSSEADIAAALLPLQETLPPTALARYAERQQQQQQARDDAAGLPSPPDAARAADQRPRGAAAKAAAAAAAAAADVVAPAPLGDADAGCRPCGSGSSSDGAAAPPELPVAVEGLRLVTAAHIVPHVDKARSGGEDAYFVSFAGHGALGVSDGVSAWAEDGIDPGEYSRTLVAYCAEAVEERVAAAARAAQRGGGYAPKFDGRAVLRHAQQCTCKPGSATVCLAALQPGGKLHVANLGDCGVRVVRNGRVVHETAPQQHDFNLPYQLSHPRLFPDTDTADSADRYVWDVQEGDVVVAASDGLFDNLWEHELLELLHRGLLGGASAAALRAGRLSGAGGSADSLAALHGAGAGAGSGGGKKKGRLSRGGSAPSLPAAAAAGGVPVVAAAAAAEQPDLPRSRSTGALSRALRRGSKSQAKLPAALLEATPDEEAGVAAPLPASPADAALGDVARAAELLAAAAAAHAADREYKSPWSVAAGRAYGLLARFFAKGGKMDDVTVVVAVVQDARRLALAGAPIPATVATGGEPVAGGRGARRR